MPADEPLLGHMIRVAQRSPCERMWTAEAIELWSNTGREAGQSVSHVHLHLLAGKRMQWPPG